MRMNFRVGAKTRARLARRPVRQIGLIAKVYEFFFFIYVRIKEKSNKRENRFSSEMHRAACLASVRGRVVADRAIIFRGGEITSKIPAIHVRARARAFALTRLAARAICSLDTRSDLQSPISHRAIT